MEAVMECCRRVISAGCRASAGKRVSIFSAAAALGIVALVGTPAWAAPCVIAPVATYTASGFSCNVDGFTFSNIVVNTLVTNGGSVTLGNFTPVRARP